MNNGQNNHPAHKGSLTTPPPFNPDKFKNNPAESGRHVSAGNGSSTPPAYIPAKKKKGKHTGLIFGIIGGLLLIGGGVCGTIWWLNRGFKVTPGTLTLESDGGEVRFHVDGPSDWQVLSTPKSWVYIGRDGEYLVCSASENNDYKRGDTIEIGNNRKSCRVILLQESGAFVAYPSEQNVQPGEGTYYYSINGQEGWRIEQGTAGWGSAYREGNQLVWRVDENHGDSRSDYVVLSNGNKKLTVGINQGAALRSNLSHVTGGSTMHTSYITISGPHDWSCRSTEYWLDVEREDNKVKLEFDKNDSGEKREGYVVVSGGGQEIRIPVTQSKPSSSGSYYYNPYWGW